MVGDFLTDVYFWTKSLHIISVISWMAGIFYLPRLFVNHVEHATSGDKVDIVFQSMEDKLFRIIMTPAMLASWGFGLLLVFTPSIIDWHDIWPFLKFLSIIGMTLFHFWLGKCKNSFVDNQNIISSRTFRITNEIPTVLMVIIVFSVIFKY